MSPATGLDLGTFFVQQVVIHRVPKARIGKKADSRPWLSEMPSVLTNDLKLYFRNRITSSLNTQRFKVVYTPLPAPTNTAPQEPPPSPSPGERPPLPIPQLILDYFGSDRGDLVPISQKMAQYLYDMQGGSSSEGLLAVVDAVIGSGTNAGACLVLLKLEDDPALSVTEVETPEGRTMQVELHNVTLPQKAKVFKVALFPRVNSLGALGPTCQTTSATKAYGSEVGSSSYVTSAASYETRPTGPQRPMSRPSRSSSVPSETTRRRPVTFLPGSPTFRASPPSSTPRPSPSSISSPATPMRSNNASPLRTGVYRP